MTKTIFLVVLLWGQPVDRPLHVASLAECIKIGEVVVKLRSEGVTYRCEER